MYARKWWLCIVATLAALSPFSAQESRGFYKDLFMDSGVRLTSTRDLPSARLLGLSMEMFVAADKGKETKIDSIMQANLITGSAIDENGILLYPDGQPRFRMVYMNGGSAGSHGTSLAKSGRARYQQFVANGGSYVGTCAGMYIASKGTIGGADDMTKKPYRNYLGIFPGWVHATNLKKSYTGMNLTKHSALLRYYNFSGTQHVDSVRHNGGCFGVTNIEWPSETEILATYETDTMKNLKTEIQDKPSIIAYKANEKMGRIVLCGSHPEAITTGDRLELMAAMVRYALDGTGKPVVKAQLTPDVTREMTKSTSDSVPAYTKIGDKQYHHFTIDVPSGVKTMTIELRPIENLDKYDVYLFANPQEMAFRDNATHRNMTLGMTKDLVVNKPKKGTWYLSVFCDTTVDEVVAAFGTQYTGRVDVLNGVPYYITVRMTK